MNGEYLKMMDFDKYWELAEPKLKEAVKTPGKISNLLESF